MKIVTSDGMRALERRCEEAGVSTDALMEQAGLAVARVAWREVGSQAGAGVLVLVGPGNNGADGLVAARRLQEWGADVTAYLCAVRPLEDPKLLLATATGVAAVDGNSDRDSTSLQALLKETRLVVDAVLGTGQTRPIEPPLARVLAVVREQRSRRGDLRLLALDLPTGLSADTGDIDPAALTSDVTVTLGCPKAGLLRLPGAESVGRLVLADIGIPPHLTEESDLELLTTSTVRRLLPSRPLRAHKGSFGKVLVVAGSRSYVGAAYLASMGAARMGAGYVTLATPASVQPMVAAKLTEATYIPLPESSPGEVSPDEAASLLHQSAGDYDVLLLGCGLGQHPSTRDLVETLLISDNPLAMPMVLDADGLNILAATPRWWERLKAEAVVTPHPGEMARLLDSSIAEVEADRIVSARAAAAHWGVTVVLKGPFTLIASPQGRVRVSPFANPALATAGTGDVLAGVVASLMAQGCSTFDAASMGVYLHGAAGDLVTADLGQAGLIASDLLLALPRARKAIIGGSFGGGVQEEP
jgi:NAD(P)H-hydrate epimerase